MCGKHGMEHTNQVWKRKDMEIHQSGVEHMEQYGADMETRQSGVKM